MKAPAFPTSRRRVGALLIFLAVLGTSGVVLAGRDDGGVLQLTISPMVTFVSGALGPTYNSPDRHRSVHCGVYATVHTDSSGRRTVSRVGQCFAASGQDRVSCSTRHPFMIEQILGLDDASGVIIRAAANGVCTGIYLDQSSGFAPKDLLE